MVPWRESSKGKLKNSEWDWENLKLILIFAKTWNTKKVAVEDLITSQPFELG